LQNIKKTKSTVWFKELRDTICTEFERLENEAPADLYGDTPGKFIYEDWLRNEKNGGGGTGGMLRGRLFEKCGVHIPEECSGGGFLKNAEFIFQL